MIKKYNIQKYHKDYEYTAPELFPLDYNILKYFETNDHRTNLKSFQFILNKNYTELKKYNDFENNILWQNGIMFAAMLGDLNAVECLLNEIGQIDDLGNTTLDYARMSNNPEVIEVIQQYSSI